MFSKYTIKNKHKPHVIRRDLNPFFILVWNILSYHHHYHYYHYLPSIFYYHYCYHYYYFYHCYYHNNHWSLVIFTTIIIVTGITFISNVTISLSLIFALRIYFCLILKVSIWLELITTDLNFMVIFYKNKNNKINILKFKLLIVKTNNLDRSNILFDY